MPARLFLSSGDHGCRPPVRFCPRSAVEGRSGRRRRPVVAGGRTCARLCFGLVHARRNPRTSRRARCGDRGVPQGADRRSRGPARRQPAADAARGRETVCMPQAYVRALFDQYAPKFEGALVDDLGYRGPALLFKAVLAVRAAAGKPALFKRAIDLGCGTGLAARPSPGCRSISSASTCRRA